MIDLALLDDKWKDTSAEHPICALCGVQIGGLKCRSCDGSGTFEFTNNNDGQDYQDFDSCGPCDGTGVEQSVPVRVWRDHPTKNGKKQEMAFHLDCEKGGLDAYLALEDRVNQLHANESHGEAVALSALMDVIWHSLSDDEHKLLDARDA